MPAIPPPRYLVGIDLGTTHTVAAWASLETDGAPSIAIFPIEQSIKPGEVAALPLLPSVRYQASLDELTAADVLLPWGETLPAEGYRPLVGELARVLGARTHGRLIASAKSWLSHPGVDRTAAILPWGAPEGVPKVSPVEASAGFLRHLRAAWNHHHPDAPLEQQELVITVPASFDEAARALTLAAAQQAGLPRPRLLEEPQAVCYDWLWEHHDDLATALASVRSLLVVDVGGGTTDLTLIRVEAGAPEPRLTRVAVGQHLMLGGDNIDLGLAHLAESRLVGPERRLSAAELSQLVEQCRLAKEQLLAAEPPESVNVTLLGGGARLIGGARSIALDRQEVLEWVLEGFFPRVELNHFPERQRSGVVEFGLPYAADPAITRHLAGFLGQHRAALAETVDPGEPPLPDALLLNGGVFRSPVIAARITEQLGLWRGRPVQVLRNARPDLAVAHGAVAYGLARRGRTIQRIGGGSARSYYLLVTAPGQTEPMGVCILPRGAAEGAELVLLERSFRLRLGSPVQFHLLASTDDRQPHPGDLVELDADRFQPLPPLVVALPRDSEHSEETVRLAATYTDIGTLDLHCLATDGSDRRWHIEFQLRAPAAEVRLDAAATPHPRVDEARERIGQVFGKKAKNADPKAVRSLRHELERLLGGRETWDMTLLRELFGALLRGLPHRRRSADHERLWCSLSGYCLRPGFGFPLDEWRVEQLFGIYEQGLQFVHESQNWAEWWTLWRRVAGGLGETEQLRIFADLADFINPATAKRGNLAALAKKRGYEDMVRLAAVLERLPVAVKVDLGDWLQQRLQKPGEPAESWWALGRIGSRIPFHGSSHNVVPATRASAWLEAALTRDFRKEPHAGFATALLARLSGDRERDLAPELRTRAIERLRSGKAPESWIGMISEVRSLSESDAKRLFGEALPPGLQLID